MIRDRAGLVFAWSKELCIKCNIEGAVLAQKVSMKTERLASLYLYTNFLHRLTYIVVDNKENGL